MSFATPAALYELLPAIYRLRDAEGDRTLAALIEVIAEQAGVLEEDIARLYDSWFIETCDEWVVPYIGDLLGVRGLHTFDGQALFSQRARVANTLAYRRRKGTATMLEQLARDTTGWPARAVEYFALLGTTQHFNHIRPANHRTPDLRDTNALELIGTGFDAAAHTADLRRIASGRGRHNLPNVGLHLWRLQSYAIPRAEARAVATPSDGRYTIHPFGIDVPLFNRPQTETDITHLAEEHNVPGPLRRRPLYDELEDRRLASLEGRTPSYRYFDDRADSDAPPVLEIYVDDATTPVDPARILICNLETWHQPAANKTYAFTLPDGSPASDVLPIDVAIDPVAGRISFPPGVTPERVRVSHACGFSGDVGGGPYNRRESLDGVMTRNVDWQAGVGKDVSADGQLFDNFTDAVVAWNAQPPGTVGVIAVLDNASYEEDLAGAARIQLAEGSQLFVVAGDWPDASGAGNVEPDERRAHLRGDLVIVGTAAPGSETPGELVVDGLMIEGATTVLPGNLGRLRLAHTTQPAGLVVEPSADPLTQNVDLEITLDRTLSGPLFVPATTRGLYVLDSVLEAPGAGAVRGPVIAAEATGTEPASTTVIERSTLLGSVHVEVLELASDVLFTEPVIAERRQSGCVRFSYVARESDTPRRYRCQPGLALDARAKALGLNGASDLPVAEREQIRFRIAPDFTSTRYGDPGYAQLGRSCADEICTGAEDGSEMGVWGSLKQPQRIANLRASLDEYLGFGLEAGLLFAT